MLGFCTVLIICSCNGTSSIISPASPLILLFLFFLIMKYLINKITTTVVAVTEMSVATGTATATVYRFNTINIININ